MLRGRGEVMGNAGDGGDFDLWKARLERAMGSS